jgi:TPR repeat protein
MKRALFILVLCMSVSFLGCEKKLVAPEGPLEGLRKTADQGNAQAQYRLGEMYDNGEGVAADDAEAVKWYRRAAEQGHPGAQWQLGYKYEYGSGVAVDNVESIKWFRKAAEQGHGIAQFELAMRYHTGKGTAKDSVEAYNWVLLAETNGIAVDAYKDLLEKEMTPEQIAEAQKQADAFVAETEKKQ